MSENLKEFIEAELNFFFGNNVALFKKKINLIISKDKEKGLNFYQFFSINKNSGRRFFNNERRHLSTQVFPKDDAKLANYYCFVLSRLSEINLYESGPRLFFKYNKDMLKEILPWVELLKIKTRSDDLEQVQIECRDELDKLNKIEFKYSQFNSLTDFLKVDDICPRLPAIDLRTSSLGLDIIEGLKKFPNGIKINKSMLVNSVDSDLLKQINSHFDDYIQLKNFENFEKKIRFSLEEFPWYGNLLKTKFKKLLAPNQNIFKNETLLHRATYEVYKDNFFINQQFYKLPVSDIAVDDSVDQNFKSCRLTR